MSRTEITALTKQQFAELLVGNFPDDWSSDEARQPGGVLYSLFLGLGVPHEVLSENIHFTFNACRIMTATDSGLDTIATDFFGGNLKRYKNESDELYRQRILVHLLAEKGTIRGIRRAIEVLTGFTPQIREPWNRRTFPVAYYDVKTERGLYWDKSRLFAPELRYQLFVDARLPAFQSDEKPQPIYGLDRYWAFDVPQCAWLKSRPAWSRGRRELDKVINATKPVGVRVWRRYHRNIIPDPFAS